MEEKIARGSCHCGKVCYEMDIPFKFVAHDHCSACRRTSSAAFVTWCGVMSDHFRLVAGEENLTTYQSSAEATRKFCSHCGSQLFFRSTRWPGEVHVTFASLTSKVKQRPGVHVYYDDRVDWFHFEDHLLKRGGIDGVQPIED